MAVTSLVLGCVAIPISFIPVVNIASLIMGGLAVVFGIIAIVKANGVTRKGRGLGIAGTILGAVAVIIAIIANIVLGAVLNSGILDALSVDTSSAGGVAGTPADPLAFDTTVTMGDGLVVTVGKVVEFTPPKDSGIDEPQMSFWAVRVTVTNSSEKSVDVFALQDGFLASGESCNSYYGSLPKGVEFTSDDVDLLGALPPAKSRSTVYAFQCPSKGSPEMLFTPELGGRDLYYSAK